MCSYPGGRAAIRPRNLHANDGTSNIFSYSILLRSVCTDVQPYRCVRCGGEVPNSLWGAKGDFAKRLLYSEDAINWVTAPQNYFGDAFPTDLKDTGTVLLAALSDGRAGFASDDRVSSWTFESTGAGERLLAIEHAPQNSNIALSEGNWVVAGNFGQAFVRLPGNGLESGDTWAVRDEMALYTWSSLGWITGGSGGGCSSLRVV